MGSDCTCKSCVMIRCGGLRESCSFVINDLGGRKLVVDCGSRGWFVERKQELEQQNQTAHNQPF